MSMTRVAAVLLLVSSTMLASPSMIRAEKAKPETSAERDARMQWFREAKFGMFIHWGLYAVPAGRWNGKALSGAGEWIMDGQNIPIPAYEKLASQFNPLKYDPARWVATAKAAGVRYIVITAKHHDGFCLFDTKATDYNVVKATPYGKCLLKPLAEECRRQGLKFCTYYSIMDWHHPAQERAGAKHYQPTRMRPGRKAEYVSYVKRQCRELIEATDTEILWFDGQWPDWWTEEDGRDLYAYLRGLKPKLIVNNRVGKGHGMEKLDQGLRPYSGDYGTPEQQIPPTGLPGVDWETCMTMNDTWGYKSHDHNWKSAETLIRQLIDTASKGGNYLLNVGPTAEGEIPPASVERLAAMGRWMKANGEAIYGTQASPLRSTPWGRCTSKVLDDDRTSLYLHVFNWPADRKLVLPGVKNKPEIATLLADGTELEVAGNDKGITITLPATMPDKVATVVLLNVEGEVQQGVGRP